MLVKGAPEILYKFILKYSSSLNSPHILSGIFPVLPVSRVFFDPPSCDDLLYTPDALDVMLRDGNHTSCLAIPDPPPSTVIVRLSRQGADLRRTTFVLVSAQDIECRPENGLLVLASAFCKMGLCGPRAICTMLQSTTGNVCTCKFRCYDAGQPYGTFHLVLRGQALKGAVCEVKIYAWYGFRTR